MKTILFSLLLALSAFAQTAKVVQLSKADADHVQALYELKQRAEAEWQAAVTDVEHKYVSESRQVPDQGESSGWLITGPAMLSLSSDNPCFYTPNSILVINDRNEVVSQGAAESTPCKDFLAKNERGRAEAERVEKERMAKLPKKTVYSLKPGWESGFEFSEGFQFIIPKPISMGNEGYFKFGNTDLVFRQ